MNGLGSSYSGLVATGLGRDRARRDLPDSLSRPVDIQTLFVSRLHSPAVKSWAILHTGVGCEL